MAKKRNPATEVPAEGIHVSVPVQVHLFNFLSELGLDLTMIEKIKEYGAETVEDLSRLNEEDLIKFNMPPLKARKLLSELAPTPVPVATPVPATTAHAALPVAQILLVQAPSEDDLLRALKLGGRAVFQAENVAAVIRAAVASRNGLFNLPKTLIDAIRAQSRAQRVPNPPILVHVRRELNRRSDLAAIFADLAPEDGTSGSAYVTDLDKREALSAFESVWPAFIGFQERLRAFRQEAFTALMTGNMMTGFGGMNPMLAMQGIDPSLLVGQTLQTDTYVDDSEGIIEAMNGIFMDQGLYASRVLGAEAARLHRILQMDGLIAAVGATNYDDMLRKLEIGVTADIVRAQQNLVTWAINVVDLKNKPDTTTLSGVLLALCNLGDQIPWNRLSNGRANLGPDDRLRNSALPGVGGMDTRLSGSREPRRDSNPSKPF